MSPSEIKAAAKVKGGLESLQKRAVELRTIPQSDTAWANAQAELKLILAMPDYKEPEQGKYIVNQAMRLEGKPVSEGDTVNAYPWQARAWGRYFKAAAALIILGLIIWVGESARSQTAPTPAQTQLYKPSILPYFDYTNNLNTNSPAIGWSNSIPANSTNSLALYVSYTNFTTNVNVIISNGTPVWSYSTNTNVTVALPAYIAVTKNSQVAIQVTFQSNASTDTNTFFFDWRQNLDGSTNAWPAFRLQTSPTNVIGAALGTETTGTNFTVGAEGYLILWDYGAIGTNWATNVLIQMTVKQGLVGL